MNGKGIFDRTLIVSDIDGTFLGAGSRIVERNITALESYKAEGGRFTVATGREWFLALRDIPYMADIVNA
ncbi:MAG: HAD hydrolase family protein, partial [Clostridia bacterium]|nr:HAD hydrolase family protein [Clostridia bacterium]